MLKKQHYIVLVLVVLLAVILLNLPTATASRLKLAISGLSFLPLFGLAASSHQTISKVGDGFTSKDELIRQLQLAQSSNQILRLELQQTAEAWRRNAELSRFYGIEPMRGWQFRKSVIIERDPASWWNTVWIDRGTKDGVSNNCPVITPDGLIGKVQLSGGTYSRVVLLGDPSLQVSVRVGASNELAVLKVNSSSPSARNMMDLMYLAGASAVGAGDKVVTSGVGGVFPSGIPVGTVVDVFPQDNGMSKLVRVKLFADMGALEDVLVMIP